MPLRVKKKHCLILSVESSSDDRDDFTCPSGIFNLDRYNSSDQRLRLNHFKLNRCLIRCHHVPPRVT